MTTPTSARTRRRPSFRVILALGLLAFFAGALQYVSYENRVVLGRWSIAYALLLVALALALGTIWLLAVRASRRPSLRSRTLRLRRRMADAAALAGGLAYLRGGLLDPAAGGRFLDLNFFGTADPVASLLFWVAMALLFAVGCLWISELRSERLARLGLSVAAVALVLLLAEGYLRVRVALHPATQGFPTYSTEAWQARFASLNDEGLRNPELPFEPPANVSRVLVVGDSTAFGFGIDQIEHRFGEQLAERLADRSGRRFEAITAALPDTHTLQHLDLLERGLRYQPEVVVLLYGLNDIDYLVKVTDRQGWGVRVLGSPLHPVGVAYRNFYSFQEIYARLRHRAWDRERSGSDPSPPVPDDLMARHLEDVASFVSLAREHACVVAVAPHGWLAQGSDFVRERYRSFVARATDANIPVWPMLEPFEGEPYDSLIVNTLDHHPNAKANEIAARAVAERVLAGLENSSQCGD